MRGKQPLPLRFRALELPREQGGRAGFLGFHELLVGLPHELSVPSERRLKIRAPGEAHQRRQACAPRCVCRQRVRLEIVFHLKAMLDVAKEAIRAGEAAGFFLGEQLVLRELLQQWKGLPALKKWAAARVEY